MIQLDPEHCALEGFMIPCSGRLTREHIISRSKTRGNAKAKDYLNQDLNFADTCMSHNVGKLSDTPQARKIMILQKIYEHGFTEMKEFYDGVPWKVAQYEFTIEAMLDASTS